MKLSSRTKFHFKIRSRNGAIVDHLQIYGDHLAHAREKLMQMYTRCEILEEREVQPELAGSGSFEDVINLIVAEAA